MFFKQSLCLTAQEEALTSEIPEKGRGVAFLFNTLLGSLSKYKKARKSRLLALALLKNQNMITL